MSILPKISRFSKLVLTSTTTHRQLANIFRRDSDPDTYAYRIARLAHALRIDNAICKEVVADDEVEELAAQARIGNYLGVWHNAVIPGYERGCLALDNKKTYLAYIVGNDFFKAYPLPIVYALQFGLEDMLPDFGLATTKATSVQWMQRLLYAADLADISVTHFPKPNAKAELIACNSRDFMWADVVRVCRGIQLLRDLSGGYDNFVVCTGKFGAAWCSAPSANVFMTAESVKAALALAETIGLLEKSFISTKQGAVLLAYRPASLTDDVGVSPNDLEAFFAL